MALPLTSEAQTEKNKISHSPILLVDLINPTIAFGSKQVTLTGGGNDTTYNDFIQLGSISGISQNMPTSLNRLSSIPSMTFAVNDFRNTLRDILFTGDPDFTSTTVIVWLKFDTGSNSMASRVRLLQGFIDTYSIRNDTLTFTVGTNNFLRAENLPTTRFSDIDGNSEAEENISLPIQYGDFNWSIDPGFFGDVAAGNFYALAPYLKTSGDGDVTFILSGHQMNQVPPASDDFPNNYTLIRRKGILCHWDTLKTVTNTAGEARIVMSNAGVNRVYLPLHAKEAYAGGSGNQSGTIDEALDGLSSTGAIADASFGTVVKVHDFRIEPWGNGDTSSNVASTFIYIGTTVSGTGGFAAVRRKSNDTIVDQVNIPGGTGEGWIEIVGTQAMWIEDLNDFYVQVETNGAGGDRIIVSAVIVAPRLLGYDPSSDDACLYVRAQGRTFSSSWDGRKSAGSLVTHPGDMIESIFREEIAGFGSIDTGTFDDYTGINGSLEVCATIFEQVQASTLLREMANAFNLGIVISPIGRVRLISPDNSIGFTDGGGSPSNEDIITDAETVSSESYNENPILRGTFGLSRTDPIQKRIRTILDYRPSFSGRFLKSYTLGSAQDIRTIRNRFIANEATAISVHTSIENWQGKQKFLASVRTFYNALAMEVGDRRNIRHGDLSDGMLEGSVNSEKWLLYDYSFNWDGTINLMFVQIGA